ncbi:MAG: hypothetical protein DCF19_05925 [Pseudanabaena frigida]|uniref:Uncharacterized protein n=1 Tax=Pseudanabaena frigida TaxID=945775 RepID=A0A2W4WEF2_9CYAN|nr:MAG: hypothetical protein DCF19_05925 [Pseudanabaena frigida]
MKSWSVFQRKIFLASIAILAIGVVFILTTISWSTNTNSLNENFSLCSAMPETPDSTNRLEFHPIKIVVEPWRGEHNVYGIFAIPLQYKDISYRSKMLVKGTDNAWDATPTDGVKYGLTTPEGYFLLVSFFRTRLTLWYLVTGRFKELQQPCNWKLYLFPIKT